MAQATAGSRHVYGPHSPKIDWDDLLGARLIGRALWINFICCSAALEVGGGKFVVPPPFATHPSVSRKTHLGLCL